MFQKEKTITITEADHIERDALYQHFFDNEKGERCTVMVFIDRDVENPREWDNLWTWVTTHGAGYSDNGFRAEDYDKEDIDILRKTALVVPLHLYRHSGDFISAGTASTMVNGNCLFDSGVMGFAFAEFTKVAGWYHSSAKHAVDASKGIITDALCKDAMKRLEAEVKAMNIFNMGAVYGFKAVNLVTEAEDSIWGNYADSKEDIADMVANFLCGNTCDSIDFSRPIAEAMVNAG